MSEFKVMKFWIGDDPELSEKVQRLLFGLGYGWSFSGSNIHHINEDRFYTLNSGSISTTSRSFADMAGEEINIDWMRTKKPETIELGGKTYIKSELEEALKHIKPVE